MNKFTSFLITMLLLLTYTLNAQMINDDLISSATMKQETINNIEIVSIKGGFGKIKIDIKNVDENPIENIEWKIKITNDNGKINNTNEGTILTLNENEIITLKSNFIFGFGNIKIDIILNDIEKSYSGYMLLFFIKVNPELTVNLPIIADGLNSPVVLTNAGDGSTRLFVADQIGIIYVIENNVLIPNPFLDISDRIVNLDSAYDERGLLGLCFHPNYELNGRFFVYYSAEKSGENIDHESILSEFKVSSENRNIADSNSENIIFKINQPESNHNGGQIEFGLDGYLYLGLGDGGGAGDNHDLIGNGQNINTLLGSIIRIDVDEDKPYTIPVDNPFVNVEGSDEIYAWGFRNPWKFSFDELTGALFVADVGQDEWEEIDIVEKGGNYGWRILEGTHPYDLELADLLDIDIEDLINPIHEYSHSLGNSITGGYLYRGTLNPSLIGKYIFGDWSSSFVVPNGKIYYIEEKEPNNWERKELIPSENFNRFILSFGEDESGELYLLSKTTLGPVGSTGDVRKIIVE
jgi:glucose/arabinose dehydrogenase